MRDLIKCYTDKCEGCNRCIRVCPVSEANIAYLENGKVKVKIDATKCIACGGCIDICQHGARDYDDDTVRFFDDLKKGVKISLIVAPARRTNLKDWTKVLAWLRRQGVPLVYDASLGADICTWAHIRLIENFKPEPIITQPCPAIVNYITKYHTELIDNLSPIQSPILCTAIYMSKYMNIGDKIAALTPCIAKAHEFEQTGLIGYNVTFKKLMQYLADNHVSLADETFQFDHFDSSMGGIYSMPGGLKENIEYYLGKAVRVDKSEGRDVVYKNLDSYAEEDAANLPAIFDVLNCSEGCNLGTACEHCASIFEINKKMSDVRKTATEKYHKTAKAQMTEVFFFFDKILNLRDFKRTYAKNGISVIPVTEEAIDDAFLALGKTDELLKQHNCYACGSGTCREMAIKVAKGINVPENCIEKTRMTIMQEHAAFLVEHKANMSNISKISDEVTQIKTLSDNVTKSVKDIETVIADYTVMSKMVSKMSQQINLLSLNATIEAARAGKAGIGFTAVVAEIRKLAVDSQESVKEAIETSVFAAETIGEINDASSAVQESVNRAFDHFVNINK